MFWGLSSALDLYDEYLKAFKLPDEPAGNEAGSLGPTELNILICGGADSRHVIKTLAKRYTHGCKPKLNFYVLEGCVELLARNMLLLGLALEPPESFSLICKTHLFMDIFGNTLMRPTSNHYVAAKSRTLLSMVCDDAIRKRLVPMLNFDTLKYRERDELEMSFSYWQPKAGPWEIEVYWEYRVRSLLGPRYDHREGAFDWDLSMTLKNREAQQICSQEYRYWRECGVAFVFPEYEHCKPNRTLAAGLVRSGNKYAHRGYLGDISTGPFCSFGLRSSEERMHKSAHGDNDYRATDVTERNLLELFHELQTQTVYKHDETISRRYGSTKLLMTPLLSFNECEPDDGKQKYDKPWIPVPDVQVHFISPMEMMELQKGGPRWRDKFDIGFMSFTFYKFLTRAFGSVLRTKALFIIETKLLTVERNEVVQKFETEIKDLLKEAGLRGCINYQAINAKNMILKYKKTPEADEEAERALEKEKVAVVESQGVYHDVFQLKDGKICELQDVQVADDDLKELHTAVNQQERSELKKKTELKIAREEKGQGDAELTTSKMKRLELSAEIPDGNEVKEGSVEAEPPQQTNVG